MVQLSTPEHALVDDLLECLAVAFARTDDVDPAYANKTKLQKLLYLAIDEFDLPLTYSWYLAGALVPGDPVSPTTLQNAFDNLPSTDQPSLDASGSASEPPDGPTAPGSAPDQQDTEPEIDQTVADFKHELQRDESAVDIDPVLFSDTHESAEPTTPTSEDELGDRRSDVIDFYERTLPDVWHQNTMQFLQNFYLSHAPEEYRELYLQSTHLRARLTDIEEAIAMYLDGDEPNQDLSSLSKAVGLEISDLHYSIRQSESLRATLPDVVYGTDLIEDGLMMLSRLEPHELTATHKEVVAEMQEFFYYWVWRLPCLIISQETATGPSADLLRTQRQEQLATFDDRLRAQCHEFERRLEQAGLKPAHTDYELPDDEFTQSAAELTEQYFE